MTKQQEIPEDSIETQILADSQLMEFLNGPGKILFDITNQEAEVLFQASSAIVELDSKKPLTVKIGSIEKLRTDIKNKQNYIKELKSKINEIQLNELKHEKQLQEIRTNVKNYSHIANEIEKKRTLNDKHNIENKGVEISNRTKELVKIHIKLTDDLNSDERQLVKIRNEVKHRKMSTAEQEYYNEQYERIMTEYKKLKLELSEINNQLEKTKHHEQELRVEHRRISQKLKNLDDNRKKYQVNRMQLSKLTRILRENKITKSSFVRKLKLAESSLVKLKEQLRKLKRFEYR